MNSKSMTNLLSDLKANKVSLIQHYCTLSEVPKLAKHLSEFFEPGDWIFLEGDMGTGKTSLSKEISIYFGTKSFFTSPTFSLLNTETLNLSKNSIKRLIHLDLYRLKTGKEICYLGLEQEFNSSNSLVLIEWPSILDQEDWQYFFNLTQCQKPKRVLNINIENDIDKRRYDLNFINI